MSEFVDYAKDLMESAKGFAEKGRRESNSSLKQAYLRASLLHGFSFLEAHLNEISDHFHNKETLTVHDMGVLLEREVRLSKGQFKLTTTPRFSRITDRIEILLKNFSKDPIKSKGSWYSDLKSSLETRNKLVHPKEKHEISHADVMRALRAIVDCIDALFQAIFSKKFPYKGKSFEGGFSF